MDKDIFHLDEPIADLEVRDYEKREIVGRFVPFNKEITVRGRKESFAFGSFDDIDPMKTVLLRNHDPNSVVGRMTALEQREDGAYATFRVAKTTLGDELLQLAAEGVLDSLSPGFVAGEQSSDGVHRRIKHLPEVSVVTWGAYPDAKVLSVRNSEQDIEPARKDEENMTDKEKEVVTDVTDTDSSDFEGLEKRFEEMNSKLTKLETFASAPSKTETRSKDIRPVDWFVAEIEATVRGNVERRNDLMSDLQKRAIADAVGTFANDTTGSTDASGLVENDYLAGQLVSVLDRSRPLLSRAGRFEMPKSGSALIPKVAQHTTVATRGTQSAEPTSRALQVQTTAYTAKWFDGALQVSYELMATAEYDVLEMVYNDLVGRYAEVTEAQFITDLEAAAGVSGNTNGYEFHGAVIDTSSYGAFAKDVAEEAINVRRATGLAATKLAIPESDWINVVSLVDANDRRQFTPGDYSDGNVALSGESFVMPGGIEVFLAEVTEAILFNESSLKVAEQAPLKLQATNVAQVTQDIAILGRTLFVPRIPGGISIFGAATA